MAFLNCTFGFVLEVLTRSFKFWNSNSGLIPVCLRLIRLKYFRASQEIRAVNAKKSAVKAPSGGDVFDKIIGNMVNPPKEKKPETSSEYLMMSFFFLVSSFLLLSVNLL